MSSHERDAFREIARALGARLPSRDEDDAAPRDLIDLAPPLAVEPAKGAPAATSAANANAEALLALLPIGAIVLRGGEPLYLNRTLLDLAGYHDLGEFRAADGLNRMFRGRDAQTLAESSDGGAIPLVAAGGELIAVDALASRRSNGTARLRLCWRCADRARSNTRSGCAISSAKRAISGRCSTRPPTA